VLADVAISVSSTDPNHANTLAAAIGDDSLRSSTLKNIKANAGNNSSATFGSQPFHAWPGMNGGNIYINN